MLTITDLPPDVFRLIYLQVANPKIARTCRAWKKMVSSPDTVKAFLAKYEQTLGKVLYQQFIERMPLGECKTYMAFQSLLQRQFSLITHYNKGIRSASLVKDPLSPLHICNNEKHIANSVEFDLYSLGLILLNKLEVHLQEEGFRQGIKILRENHQSTDRYLKVVTSKAGSRLWKIITENIDLSVIKDLTLEPPMRSIPRQIVQLVGLENLSIDKGPLYLPAALLMLNKLKVLNLRGNHIHLIAPELYLSEKWVIKNALFSCKILNTPI